LRVGFDKRMGLGTLSYAVQPAVLACYLGRLAIVSSAPEAVPLLMTVRFAAVGLPHMDALGLPSLAFPPCRR